MTPVRPFPSYLVSRFRGWKATEYAENRAWYRRLAEEGQRPRAMILSCCDSRIHISSIFGEDSGDFFIHRNIANLVPPYEPSGDRHGTSAAIEYAVSILHVAHVIVLGHSSCGGVSAYHDMRTGNGQSLRETSFIGPWMDILSPAWERMTLPGNKDRDAALRELGMLGVLVSLENLATFPFIAEAIADDRVTLHGAWLDIGSGELAVFDPEGETFRPLTAA